MKKILKISFALIIFLSIFRVEASFASDKVEGYTAKILNIRENPNGKTISYIPRFSFVSGEKSKNWIKLSNNRYIFDLGLIEGEKVEGYIPKSTNIRHYYNNRVIGVKPGLTKITGIKSGDWITFEFNGGLAKLYDFGLIEGRAVKGYVSTTTNVRNTPTGYVIGQNKAGTYIEGIKVGDWIWFDYNGVIAATYDFSLLDKYDMKIPTDTTNIVGAPILIERELKNGTYYPVFVKLSGYLTAENAENGINPIKTFEPGNYFIYKTEGNLINITTNKNVPGAWINSFYNDRTKREKRKTNPTEFLKKIAPIAQKLAYKNDLYASVMIAQSMLESGYGTTVLGEEPYNNLFGIKGGYNGDSVAIPTYEYTTEGTKYLVVAPFKKYPTYYESLLDYVNLLTGFNNPSSWRYKYYYGARKSQTNSYKDATAHLTGKYATSLTYGASLNRLIEQYNLTIFDN